MGIERLEIASESKTSAAKTAKNLGPEAFRGLVAAECKLQTETLQPVMVINGDEQEAMVGVDIQGVSCDVANEHLEAIDGLERQEKHGKIVLGVMTIALVAACVAAQEIDMRFGLQPAATFLAVVVIILAIVRLTIPTPSESRLEIAEMTAERTFLMSKTRERIRALLLGRAGLGMMRHDGMPIYVSYADVSAVWQNRSDNKVRISFESGRQTIILHRPELGGGEDLGASRERPIVDDIAARVAAAKGFGERQQSKGA